MRAEPFAENDLARDAFLSGRVWLRQPKSGYRAGTDPVILAAATAARSGQSVLELGCGAGAALCCLGQRVPGVALHGIELMPAYAALAQQNLRDNGLEGTVWTGDLVAPPREMRQISFDHVIANPPYFEAGKGVLPDNAERALGRAGDTPLSDWVAVAARRVKPRGYVTMIQRAERLPEVLGAMQVHLGALELLPLVPRAGRAPRLILVRGRKDGRAPFRFFASKVIHAGTAHVEGDSYTDSFRGVMREGHALDFSA